MWGGVKKRVHHGDLFRNWSATRSLDDLRSKLWQEPRPWYLAFALHKHAHLLPDAHCARLISWCTTVVQLRRSAEAKREAFRYAQETFNMMVHSHKAGTEAFGEYMRLCAVGKDLSTAFQWHQYWIETDRDGALAAPKLLFQLTWLLRLSLLTPSDESAEDMARAVHQCYTTRFGSTRSHAQGDASSTSHRGGESNARHDDHYQPIAEDEVLLLRQFFAAFKQLRPRLQSSPSLLRFIDGLPISDAEAARTARDGWPCRTANHHHTFAHLEQGVPWQPPTLAQPRLCDSLLHPDFIAALERAAFDHRVGEVIGLMREYEERVRLEAERRGGHAGHTHRHAARALASEASWHSDELWRQWGDTTAVQFRKSLVFGVEHTRRREATVPMQANAGVANHDNNNNNNSGSSKHEGGRTHHSIVDDDKERSMDTNDGGDENGSHRKSQAEADNRTGSCSSGGGELTSELYHYLIVALSVPHPTAALRTLQRMREANLRILDLTRTVALVAARGSWDDQVALFREQLREMDEREQLDRDFALDKVIEAYWKYQYPLFLHYRNALDRTTFYRLLMDGLGVAAVQQLLTAAGVYEGHVATGEESYVVMDDALRGAAVAHLRAHTGAAAVQQAMDVITQNMPQLDISVVGSVPHFDHYALPPHDRIATDAAMLQAMMSGYDDIFVLDTSFVETSEYFVHVGSDDDARRHLPHPAASRPPGRSLVLVPYLVLTQLAQSMALRHAFDTADPALQESVHTEPFLASQRLRALYTMIATRAGAQVPPPPSPSKKDEGKDTMGDKTAHKESSRGTVSNSPCAVTQTPHGRTRHVRLLHFSECLLAHAVSSDTLTALGLAPDGNDDDQLLLVLAMLRALAPPRAGVTLCSDDATLQSRVRQLQIVTPARRPPCALFAGPVHVLCTDPPAQVDVQTDLINDNPRLSVGANFEPRLDFPAARGTPDDSCTGCDTSRHSPASLAATPASIDRPIANGKTANDASEDEEEASVPSWLDMLDSRPDDDSPYPPSTPSRLDALDRKDQPDKECGTPAPRGADANEASARRSVMQLYESEHAVIPIGVKMEQASRMGSIFEQFHVNDPDEAELRRLNEAAQPSRRSSRESAGPSDFGGGGEAVSQTRGGSSRRAGAAAVSPRRAPSSYSAPRSSVLSREARANRGLSLRERVRLARSLSNRVGKRVPFNLRYRAVYANVNDPRYAHLRTVYKDQLEMKRRAFRRSIDQP